MMIQKRFPDLTAGASEIEQDHIHTLYYQKDTARYIQIYISGIHSLYSNKHLKYLRGQEYITEKK